jgi:UrcA family protein
MSVLFLAAVASSITLVPTQHYEPRQARVQYDDIDLSSPTGREQLDKRITQAVHMVCDRVSSQSFYEQQRIRKCQKRAMAKIAPQREIAIAKSGVKLARGF